MSFEELINEFVKRLEPQSPFVSIIWILSFTVLFSGIVFIPKIWEKSRFFITLIHEFGHAFIGLTVGDGLTGIKIHHDTSGVTNTLRQAGIWGWFKSKITTYAGYAAPAVFSFLLLFAVNYGFSNIAMLVIAVMFLFILLFMRNLRGLGLAFCGFAASILAFWFLPLPVQSILHVLMGSILLFGGVKSLWELQVQQSRGEDEGSDVWALTRNIEPFRGLIFISYYLLFAASFGFSIYLTLRLEFMLT